MTTQFTAEGFTGGLAHLNGKGAVGISVADLVRSSLTCGHLPPGHFWPFHGYRGHSAIWRESIVRAHLDVRGGRLRPTSEFWLLEPTERGFVSGLMASAITHLFAQQAVGIPVLLHLSTYSAAFHARFDGRQRPDFIAPMPSGGWAIFESKGRSRRRNEALAYAKQQTMAVRSIHGEAPNLRVACLALFRKSGVDVHLLDPPGQIQIEARREDIVREYYATVTEFLDRGPVQERSDGYTVTRIDELDLEVGLAHEVLERLSTDWADSLAEGVGLQLSSAQLNVPRRAPGLSFGPDGVMVALGSSWDV